MTAYTGVTKEVHPFNMFRIYRSEDDDLDPERPLKTMFLLQLSATGKAEDNFRFALEGGGHIEADFQGSDLFRLKTLRSFSFKTQVPPSEVDLRRNALTSAWKDLNEAVEEGDIMPVSTITGLIAPEEFGKAWAAARASNPDLGAAVRWAVLASADGLKLVWQGMPASAGKLNKDPRLSNDACPAIGLSSFELEADISTVGPLSGPKPVLFSRSPSKTLESLKKTPAALATGKNYSETLKRI